MLEAYNPAMLPVIVLALLVQPAGTSVLRDRLAQAIASSGAEVAIVYARLDGGETVDIDGGKPFHAASTMKVPVMIELFRQARAGTVSLDEPLAIRNEFRSIVDGSVYKLGEGDDSDRQVYAAMGRTLTLAELCEAMITVSSNFATNLLIEKLGVDNVRGTVTRLGADRDGGMQVLRGVEDSKAFAKGLNNSTTARGLATLLLHLAKGTAVDRESDAAMIEILKRQKFRDGIPSALPAGVAVAHKTGNITRIHHDAGIVFASRPHVLVILTRGIEDQKESAALIGRLTRLVYDAATRAD
jgi:beta-lactamase class A